MKSVSVFFAVFLLLFVACTGKQTYSPKETEPVAEDANLQKNDSNEETFLEIIPEKIIVEIEKAFLYDKYTLEDTYPYGNGGVREFQWEKIKNGLAYLDSFQQAPALWGILQNRKNKNGEAPLVREWDRDEYKLVSDMWGVERFQSIPMYREGDSIPERYSRDGFLVKIIANGSDSSLIENINFAGRWIVPNKYIYPMPDSIQYFTKIIFIDKTNQNIATMEKSESKWLVRSMNPATTGVHSPPYRHETPNGIFVVQEKKSKMYYLLDGSGSQIEGYAPYASRFSNGGYIHGVPVNDPNGAIIEYSWSLGTTPRSHMCVRNASSHAKFIYNWSSVNQALVFVFE